MPRQLSTTLSGLVEKQITRPQYLIQVGTHYWSTATEISYNGNTYIPNNIKVNLNPDRNLGNLIIPNNNYSLSPELLTNGINDEPVNIYLVYEENTDPENVICLVNGYVSACSISRNIVNLAFVSNKQINTLLPKLSVSPGNGFHFIPYYGQKITWQGEIYIVRRNY